MKNLTFLHGSAYIKSYDKITLEIIMNEISTAARGGESSVTFIITATTDNILDINVINSIKNLGYRVNLDLFESSVKIIVSWN